MHFLPFVMLGKTRYNENHSRSFFIIWWLLRPPSIVQCNKHTNLILFSHCVMHLSNDNNNQGGSRTVELGPQDHGITPSLFPFSPTCRMENANTAKKVLSAVEETLRLYPFRFQGARILSGEEEGAYGWITLNYLLGNFKEVMCHVEKKMLDLVLLPYSLS